MVIVTKQRIEQIEDAKNNVILSVDVEHRCNKEETISLMRYEIRIKQDKDIVILNADMIKSINKLINKNYKEIKECE